MLTLSLFPSHHLMYFPYNYMKRYQTIYNVCAIFDSGFRPLLFYTCVGFKYHWQGDCGNLMPHLPNCLCEVALELCSWAVEAQQTDFPLCCWVGISRI